MLWPEYHEEYKWAVAIQRFSGSSARDSRHLELFIGDVVYILRFCQDWFYGFKADCTSKCGIFPKCSVAIRPNSCIPEVDADLQVMFAALLNSFSKKCEIDRLLPELFTRLSRVIDKKTLINAKAQSNYKYNTEKEVSHIRHELFVLSAAGQRNLELPFTLPSYMTNRSLIDLHKKHIEFLKEINDAEVISQRSTSQPFSLLLEFDRLPPRQFAVYLASRQIQTNDGDFGSLISNLGRISGGNFDALGGDDLARSPHIKFSEITRLTENVFLNGELSTKEKVVFLDLDPVQMEKNRVLLIVLVTRFGIMHSKGAKSARSQSYFRRPVGVACVDITQDIEQYQTNKDRASSANALVRVVSIPPMSDDQTVADVLPRRVDECRPSLRVHQPRVGQLHSASVADFGAGEMLSPRGSGVSLDSLEFDLVTVSVFNPQQAVLLQRASSLSSAKLGHRYDRAHRLPGSDTGQLSKLYLHLVSGDFPEYKPKKNIEVTVTLRDAHGNQITWGQSASELTFTSIVYQHKCNPVWRELFTIPLPPFSTGTTIKAETVVPSSPNDSCPSLSSVSSTSSFMSEFHLEKVVGRTGTMTPGGQTLQSGRQASSVSDFDDLAVPDSLSGKHLQFLCRHRSSSSELKDKILGVAYLRLQLNPNIPVLIPDGSYKLIVYKQTREEIDKCAYLSYTCSRDEVTSSRSLNTLSINTHLCSDHHTTDEHLARVLLWPRYQENIVNCLLSGIYNSKCDNELQKFTRPLIDSLLQVLSSSFGTSNQPNLDLGFSAIMALARCFRDLLVQSIYLDPFYQYLQSSAFSYTTVHHAYLRLLNSLLEVVLCNGNPGGLALPKFVDGKAIDLILSRLCWAFRIIVRSRRKELKLLPPDSPGLAEDSDFNRQLNIFWTNVIQIASAPFGDNNEFITHQKILVKSVPEIIKDLLKVYRPTVRLAEWISTLIRCTLTSPHLPNQRILVETLQSRIFEQQECRDILLGTVSTSLKFFFAELLAKVLDPNLKENQPLMECWCDLLTMFVSRLLEVTTTTTTKPQLPSANEVQVVSAEGGSSTPGELLHQLLSTSGSLLRWCIRQLTDTLLFIQDNSSRNSTSRSWHISDLTDELQPLATRNGDAFTVWTGTHRLQPIASHLFTCLLSLLGHLDAAAWQSLLHPATPPSTSVTDCRCPVCAGLAWTEVFDRVHELVNLFTLSHAYPMYSSTGASGRTQEMRVRLDGAGLLNLTHPGGVLFGDLWIEMSVAASREELAALQMIYLHLLRPILTGQQLSSCPGLPPDHPFTADLVCLMQQCLGTFIADQNHLSLEKLPWVVRRRTERQLLVVNDCGSTTTTVFDLREEACRLLELLWNDMSDQVKANSLGHILPTVIRVFTVPLKNVRAMCLRFIFDAFRLSPSEVGDILISEIDRVVHWAGIEFAETMRDMLQTGLEATFPKATWWDGERVAVLDVVIQQLKYFVNYGELLNQVSGAHEMLVLYSLREFYVQVRREYMSVRYLFRLERLHARYQTILEQGYTLELIAKHYTWEETPVDTGNLSSYYAGLGLESSRALRECLLLDSAQCLQAAYDWQHAIEVYDHLVELYRTVAPDYDKLHEVLKQQAALSKKIVSKDSFQPKPYFYVLRFYGSGPTLLTNRSFICRTLESGSTFLQTLEKWFPNWELVLTPPDPKSADSMPRIWPSNLVPVCSIPSHLVGKHVNHKIRQYYRENHINCFQLDRKCTESASDSATPELQVERTFYHLNNTMPGIVSIMPATQSEPVKLSPAELAIDSIRNNIFTLDTSIAQESEWDFILFCKHMEYVLCNSIWPLVSGGLLKLLRPIELSDEPGHESILEEFQTLLYQLFELQLAGLTIWHQVCPTHSALPVFVDAYIKLTQELGHKFGFSVDHLNVSHLQNDIYLYNIPSAHPELRETRTTPRVYRRQNVSKRVARESKWPMKDRLTQLGYPLIQCAIDALSSDRPSSPSQLSFSQNNASLPITTCPSDLPFRPLSLTAPPALPTGDLNAEGRTISCDQYDEADNDGPGRDCVKEQPHSSQPPQVVLSDRVDLDKPTMVESPLPFGAPRETGNHSNLPTPPPVSDPPNPPPLHERQRRKPTLTPRLE